MMLESDHKKDKRQSPAPKVTGDNEGVDSKIDIKEDGGDSPRKGGYPEPEKESNK